MINMTAGKRLAVVLALSFSVLLMWALPASAHVATGSLHVKSSGGAWIAKLTGPEGYPPPRGVDVTGTLRCTAIEKGQIFTVAVTLGYGPLPPNGSNWFTGWSYGRCRGQGKPVRWDVLVPSKNALVPANEHLISGTVTAKTANQAPPVTVTTNSVRVVRHGVMR